MSDKPEIDNAERAIREGDVDRFWEVFGPDGVYELFERGNTLGRKKADTYTTRLRHAIADEAASRIGNLVLELVWGVYLKDARTQDARTQMSQPAVDSSHSAKTPAAHDD